MSCLQEADVKIMAKWIAMDMDCTELCALAVAAMSRGSMHAKAICAWCADVYQSCGDECIKHDMDYCQACAKACYDCAKACRQMATAA